jgi:fructokinase
MTHVSIGIDFGGTKIEAAALDGNGEFAMRLRTANPGNYDDAIRTVVDLIASIESRLDVRTTVGVGAPGSVSPTTGTMRNANSVYLNGRRFVEDLGQALGREIRLANDANCFALSEVVDGAAMGSSVAFGAILGTGCGGGLVIDGRLVEGANGIAGEWGHVPLPWPTHEEIDAPPCWCGRQGCLETWISGTGLARDFVRAGGGALTAEAIIESAQAGDPLACRVFDRYVDRLARALAMIANVVDPDTFVFGGGMSNARTLYERLPQAVRPYIFSDHWHAKIVPARWGDSSGVRGAARLWSS